MDVKGNLKFDLDGYIHYSSKEGQYKMKIKVKPFFALTGHTFEVTISQQELEKLLNYLEKHNLLNKEF